jgi:hypothetical protein
VKAARARQNGAQAPISHGVALPQPADVERLVELLSDWVAASDVVPLGAALRTVLGLPDSADVTCTAIGRALSRRIGAQVMTPLGPRIVERRYQSLAQLNVYRLVPVQFIDVQSSIGGSPPKAARQGVPAVPSPLPSEVLR